MCLNLIQINGPNGPGGLFAQLAGGYAILPRSPILSLMLAEVFQVPSVLGGPTGTLGPTMSISRHIVSLCFRVVKGITFLMAERVCQPHCEPVAP
jgi:hypothetical protein